MAVDTTPQAPAIILGDGYGSLGVVHCLAAHAVRCWVCAPKRGPAGFSRHARFVRIADPRRDEPATIEDILRLARSLGGRPVVVPAYDHYVMALAQHRALLQEHVELCLAPSATVALVSDQLAFASWARGLGLDIPRSAPATAIDDNLRFPIVAKPLNMQAFAVAAQALPAGTRASDLRFTLLRSESEWHHFRSRLAANLQHFVLQEYVAGTTADMYSIGLYVDRKGQILAQFVARKIRGYPALFGDAKSGQNDVVPPEILAQVAHVVRALGLTGIAEFEYKRDPATGKFHLIEINPRCWGWVALCRGTAADVPWAAYRDLCGLAVEPAVYNRDAGRLKYVLLVTELTNVLLRYRWDYPPWVMPPRAWWNSLRADRLVIGELALGDWPVLLYAIAQIFREAFLLLKRGIRFAR